MSVRTRQAREYMGTIIMPAARNASGIRWYAYVGIGTCLRADTLAGVKALIRSDRQRDGLCR
jgi:hypothetical protein